MHKNHKELHFINFEYTLFTVCKVTTPYSLIYDKIIVSDGNLGQHGQMDIYCDDYELNYGVISPLALNRLCLIILRLVNCYFCVKSSQSCEYFSVEKKPLENSQYQVFVRLIKNLDKSQFLVTITARVTCYKSTFTPLNNFINWEQTLRLDFRKQAVICSLMWKRLELPNSTVKSIFSAWKYTRP